MREPIPAADFDFSAIKAGDRITVRFEVENVSDFGVRATLDAIRFQFARHHIVSVIPAPTPKSLRERAFEAAVAAHSTDLVDIVDAVLALFSAEEGQ